MSVTTSSMLNDHENAPWDGLSVIILCVLASPHLVGAVQSLVDQDDAFEIIVVNSGGGDAGALLGPLASKVRLYESAHLLWPGEARNVGLNMARGQYVAFLASDCRALPGWVSGRLRRHRKGSQIVTNPVANPTANNPVAWASHIANFGKRLTGLPADMADPYGASYNRSLFEQFGPFRADLRIGEDTEFANRTSSIASEWAQDVQTEHLHPTALKDAVMDSYARGRRLGYHWRRARNERFIKRVRRRLGHAKRAIESGIHGRQRLAAIANLPLISALVIAHEMGFRRSLRRANMVKYALRDGDREKALAVERQEWISLAGERSVLNIIDILTANRDEPGLDAFLATLNQPMVPERLRVFAITRRLEATHDWDGIVQTLGSRRDLYTQDVTLLNTLVSAHLTLGGGLETIELVDQFAGARRERARYLGIEIKLSCRDLPGAWRDYEMLDPTVKSQIPKHLVGSLFQAALLHDGSRAASAFLELANTKATDKSSALLFELLKWRMESILAIESQQPTKAPNKPPETRLLEKFGSGEDWQNLVATARRFEKFRTHINGFFPEPTLLVSDAIAVARSVSEAVGSGKPFSLVRLGDGEGNLLPYRQRWHRFVDADYASTRTAWWGHNDIDMAERNKLQRLLTDAIETADIIGIPELHRISNTTAINKNLRGLLANHDYLEAKLDRDPTWFDGRIVTSCHIHQALSYWGLWELILARAPEASVITCHPDLARALSERYGLPVRRTILIPGEAKYRSTFGTASRLPHFPDCYEKIMAEIAGDAAPGLVLVAAGVLGKSYCAQIKQAGGIGLDIGSLADHLCGFRTRSLEEMTMFEGPPGIKTQVKEILSR